MNWNPVSKMPEPYRPFLIKRNDGRLYIEEFDPDSKFPSDAVGWVYVIEGD